MIGKRRHRLLIWIASLLLTATAIGGDIINVTGTVDKQSAYVGDIITYTVTVNYDSSVRVSPPPVGRNLGQFDIKDYKVGEEKRLKNGRVQQVLRFQIRAFAVGGYVISPLSIEYMLADSSEKQVMTSPIKIEIKSLLATGAAVDTLKLRPLKGQVSLATNYAKIIIFSIVAGLVALAIVIFLIFRRRKPIGPKQIIDLRPAWEIALADLTLLREKNLPSQGEIKQYYVELSDIIRKYLGGKFEFYSIDMTTEELISALNDILIADTLRQEIALFMEHADLVKFAKYIPPVERCEQDFYAACELVNKSKDIIVARVPVEPEPVAVVVSSYDTDNSDLKYAPPELRRSTNTENGETGL